MWMGGVPPLGYNPPTDGSRKLKVNVDEAEQVRLIFSRYLELGSVHALQRDLEARGFLSKLHVTAKGKPMGGLPFSRGALFHLLRNRIYLGQIVHKDHVFDGEHDGIVEPDLFERVQRTLNGNARRHNASAERRVTKAPLTGKLFDANGDLMTPTFSRGRSDRVYRYYVSGSLQQGAVVNDDDTVQRLPASAIEDLVFKTATRWMPLEEHPLRAVLAIRIADGGLVLDCPAKQSADIAQRLQSDERIIHSSAKLCRVHLPATLPLRGGQRLIVAGGKPDIRPDQTLITALRRAHSLLGRDRKGMPLIDVSPSAAYQRMLIKLAFLAPDIQRGILEGRQPSSLNLQQLIEMTIPLCWNEQRKALNWPSEI